MKLRPIAESIAIHQVAGHRQAGFRVQDGAEARIGAVRRPLKDADYRVLVQCVISNADGSLDRLAVLRAVKRHVPSLCVPHSL